MWSLQTPGGEPQSTSLGGCPLSIIPQTQGPSTLSTSLLSPGSLTTRTSKVAMRLSRREDACCCHESPTDLGLSEVRAHAPHLIPHSGGETWPEIALHSVECPSVSILSSRLGYCLLLKLRELGQRGKEEQSNRAGRSRSLRTGPDGSYLGPGHLARVLVQFTLTL